MNPEVEASVGSNEPVFWGGEGDELHRGAARVGDGEFEVFFVGAEAIGGFDEHIGELEDWFGVAEAERFEEGKVFVEREVEEGEVGNDEVFFGGEVDGLVGEVEGFVELVDAGFEFSEVGREEGDAGGFVVAAAFDDEVAGGFDGGGEREVAETAGGGF